MAEIIALCTAEACTPPIARQDVCLVNGYAETSEAALYKNALTVAKEHFNNYHRILDLAAGTGAMGQLLKSVGFEDIHAIDYSNTLLKVARKRQSYKTYTVEVPQESGELSALESDSYDGVVAVAAFDPGRFKPDYCKEVYRTLRLGGIAVIASREHLLKDLSTSHPHWPYHLEKSLQALEDSHKWGMIDRRVFNLKPGSNSTENKGIYSVFKKGASHQLAPRWTAPHRPLLFRPSHNIAELFYFDNCSTSKSPSFENNLVVSQRVPTNRVKYESNGANSHSGILQL